MKKNTPYYQSRPSSFQHKYPLEKTMVRLGTGKGVGQKNSMALDYQYQHYLTDQARLFRHFINLYAFAQAGVPLDGIDKAIRELRSLDALPQCEGIQVSPELEAALTEFAIWAVPEGPMGEWTQPDQIVRRPQGMPCIPTPPSLRSRSSSFEHIYSSTKTEVKAGEGKDFGRNNAIALDYQYQHYLTDQGRLFRHFISIYAFNKAGVPQDGLDKARDELDGDRALDELPQFQGIRVSPELDVTLTAFSAWAEARGPINAWAPPHPGKGE